MSITTGETQVWTRTGTDLGQGGSHGRADHDVVIRVEQELGLAQRGDDRGDGLERRGHVVELCME